jgi:hypothetical protein
MSDDPLSKAINSIPPEKLEAFKEDLFDFKTGGMRHIEAANKFQAGLDKVIDVLLVLVMKFGRATTVLVVAGIVALVNLIALLVVTINIFVLRSEVRDLLYQQEDFARSQRRIERTATETQEKVESTGKAVEATKTAVETVPKVELDRKTGKAKLVVQVPPKAKAPPVASGAPSRQVEIKLE